jgi:hypothetical protein
MGSSLLRGPVGRTVVPLLVMIGGFAGLYAATGNPFVCVLWASITAHIVLLIPWSVDGGRANHTSVLFLQPVAMSDSERERINLDGVTAGQRGEAAAVVATVFALMLAALALALTG